ncbi:BRO-N domain-containing protein [Paralysiella testudinis]|uniref:Bro-N domain-containing protein n=1 Tax=Paralysiella testudinis TaxID=2809020 RepID=A0A892ZIS7_9NEIS|nr:Bro-N domain-containing protein [Paralysiella testudinis]QRQ82832.1 Bro-N domain-containing protein [Paralysiella testudinis]
MASQNLLSVGATSGDTPHQTFNFDHLPVRTVNRDGEIWFVAADVCAALELANPRQVVSRLDDDEKGVLTVDTLGGPQEVVIVSESGLYSLILTSRKEEAKRFKRWVTHDVLPAIRTTGKYEAKPGRGRRAVTQQARQVPLLPAPRNIRRRDDLSFTRRKPNGNLINWTPPTNEYGFYDWYEAYGIGEAWLEEVVELSKHNHEEAYYALKEAARLMSHYIRDVGSQGAGHVEGFFARMARYTLAGMISHPKGVSFPFVFESAKTATDSLAVYLQQAAPLDQEELKWQAWMLSEPCRQRCYEQSLHELLCGR